MTKEQNELIDYLENLPKRGDVIFSEGFQPDDYSTALGRLRKSINDPEAHSERCEANEKVCKYCGHEMTYVKVCSNFSNCHNSE